MSEADQTNADQLAFWNGAGGRTWVARQGHTDLTLTPISDAFLGFADPRSGDRVLDVGCGCGATTLELARAVGPSGRVCAFDISSPMLEEGAARATARGISNVVWFHADPATAALEPYDLLTSAFGVMFFGNPVEAFAHMRRAASPGARVAFVCWCSLQENPWIEVPMRAVARHLPPRPERRPHAPGMFAFADPEHLSSVLRSAGWARPQLEKLEVELDIAAGGGIEAAVMQSTQIGAVHSWLRDQAEDVVSAAVASLREALMAHVQGDAVRLPAAVWLVRTAVG